MQYGELRQRLETSAIATPFSCAMIVDNPSAYQCIVQAELSLAGSAMSDTTRGQASYLWERALKRVLFTIEGFQGRLWRQDEDGILASFPDVESGVLAAWEIRFRLSSLPPVSGVRVSLRAGCDYGRVQEIGDEIGGEAVLTSRKLMQAAQPGQILASRRVAMELAPMVRQSLAPFSSPAFPDDMLMELHFDPISSNHRPPKPTTPYCLHLEKDERRYLVDEESGVVSLGRDPACDLVVSNPKASRRHGWIGKVDGKFVVIDKSSNGTFVSFADGSETLVRNGQLALSGRGRISFGHAIEEGMADVFNFEVRL